MPPQCVQWERWDPPFTNRPATSDLHAALRRDQDSPMCVIQVNVVDAEFLERLVGGLPSIGRRTVDYLPRRRTATKLACQEYLAALSCTLEPVQCVRVNGQSVRTAFFFFLPFTDELF